LADLLDQLPASLRDGPEAKLLRDETDRQIYNIVQLIYRAKKYEGHSKDFEFSRASMREHWRAGYNDPVRTLRHLEVLQRSTITKASSPSISIAIGGNDIGVSVSPQFKMNGDNRARRGPEFALHESEKMARTRPWRQVERTFDCGSGADRYSLSCCRAA
jgi:patatin-like phospholipase